MANATTFAVSVVQTITAQQLTLAGSTYAVTDAGAAVPTDGAAIAALLEVFGDIDGLLYFAFADPDTLEGVINPADASLANIILTEAAAGGVTALIIEEIFAN